MVIIMMVESGAPYPCNKKVMMAKSKCSLHFIMTMMRRGTTHLLQKKTTRRRPIICPLQQNDDDKTNKGREIRIGGKCSKNTMKTTMIEKLDPFLLT
jgi:hypothetical protein